MNQISKLNKLFSRSTLRGVLEYGQEYLTSLDLNIQNEPLIDKLNDLYNYLNVNYRNEYFYKNTILNKKLLGTYSVNTTVALSEIFVGKSKPDLIIINGQAIVYEIKTEYDNFSRLENQLNDYYKAFKQVYVVTSESKEEPLQRMLTGSSTGIIVLTKRNTLSVRKEATEKNDTLQHESMFQMLRKLEYESLIFHYFGKLPNTKPVNLYNKCLEWFETIEKNEAYELMIAQLKCRNIREKESFQQVPSPLRFLTYFENLSETEYDRLNNILYTEEGI